MQQRSLVILTPIRADQVDSLRDHLAEKTNPRWNSYEEQQICPKDMPFDQLTMLHFSSFAILDEDTGPDPIQPCLMFEATVDGSPSDFLDELIDLCGTGLHEIYCHCDGYPTSGVTLPHLVKGYLAAHDVHPNIYFQGHPGRTISEIHGEDSLRRRLIAELLPLTQQTAEQPKTRHAILRTLRRCVASDPTSDKPAKPEADAKTIPGFRWATEARAEPVETRWGRKLVVLAAVGLALLLAAIGLVLAAPYAGGFVACMRQAGGPFSGCAADFADGWVGDALSGLILWPFRWGGWFLSWIVAPGGFLWTAAAVGISWAMARGLQFLCAAVPKPGDAGVGWVLLQALLLAARLATWLSLAALAALALSNLTAAQTPYWVSKSNTYAILTALLAVLVGIPALLFVRYIRTMPSLDGSFGHASAAKRAALDFASDALRLFMAALIWLIVVAVDRVIGVLPDAQGPIYAALVTWGTIGAVTVLGVLAVLLTGVTFWLLIIYAREKLHDDRRYLSAEVLTETPDRPHRYAREGHEVNKVQNHLISLSRIKPGRLRLLRLRLVLFIVNLMCRWWFTRGALGDVRDIHFLRWIIIDKGRRLLFLDTYQGSWSGYLDAFIDSGSVHGLNAIWSHTYQHVAEQDRPVGFPRTECLAWKGARNERPFKAAVRASQKETIVWYSGYPRIGGVDIITNSKIRDNLFNPLDTAGIDMLISNIR